MLYCNEEIQKLYIEYMNSIKELVREKREVLTSPVYLAGRRQYMRKKRTLRSRLTDKITGKRNKATSTRLIAIFIKVAAPSALPCAASVDC